MIAALVLAAAPAAAAPTAIDAERAFAADAQKLGQWTAFRKYAADNAVMFVPQQVNAQDFLKPLKDPPIAVFWWPDKSFVSCDGSYAINTGPWVRQWGKSVGYFTTVWKRQGDASWKWIYDGGDGLETPRAEGGDIKPLKASCESQAPFAHMPVPERRTSIEGQSPDGSLRWVWITAPDGARAFAAYLWTGQDWKVVVNDHVKAPSQ